MSSVRPPAVAGSFYPQDPEELAEAVDALYAQGPPAPEYSRVVIAPHAGYIYSGPTAAISHQALDPKTRRVLILGPTHRVGIRGMALTGVDYQRTPLGDIPTDSELTALLEEMPEVITSPVVHAQEHSMEVQLPFLQRHLDPGFTVVPVAVGQADPQAVAAVISAALQLPDTAVVVSSDLSHYLPYKVAKQVDAQTLSQIAEADSVLTGEQACGAYPVSGLMCFAREHDLQATLLDARNSGDTAGDRAAVVGYPAVAWYPPGGWDAWSAGPPALAADDTPIGPTLTTLAYNAVAERLGETAPTSHPCAEVAEELKAPGACFVTLTLEGRLRGCIGSLVAYRSLEDDVRANAVAAAFEDPRFPPLTAAELARTELEVSVLTPPVAMWGEDEAAPSEASVVSHLVPGVDGVVLRWGAHRATYLPQVWEQIPDPGEFLTNLKVKAGLPAGFWSDQIRVDTYRVREYRRAADTRR